MEDDQHEHLSAAQWCRTGMVWSGNLDAISRPFCPVFTSLPDHLPRYLEQNGKFSASNYCPSRFKERLEFYNLLSHITQLFARSRDKIRISVAFFIFAGDSSIAGCFKFKHILREDCFSLLNIFLAQVLRKRS